VLPDVQGPGDDLTYGMPGPILGLPGFSPAVERRRHGTACISRTRPTDRRCRKRNP